VVQDSPVDVFPAVAAGRRSVADLLEGLDEQQLTSPSLCAGWDVRTVGAHLAGAAAPALGTFLVAVMRAGGRVHRANDAAAHRAARRPVAETVARLRQHADNRSAPPVTGPRAPLTDVLVHEGDIRLPLGLAYDPDAAAVRTALEFVTTGRPVGFVPRGRLTGLRLVATNLDWSWGSGPETSGLGVDLLMAACGRTAALPQLEGPGSRLLRERLGGS